MITSVLGFCESATHGFTNAMFLILPSYRICLGVLGLSSYSKEAPFKDSIVISAFHEGRA